MNAASIVVVLKNILLLLASAMHRSHSYLVLTVTVISITTLSAWPCRVWKVLLKKT